MKIRVVFYGGLKQHVGAKEQMLELSRNSITVRELADLLRVQHPALNPRLGTVAYVVNDEMVGLDYGLKDGDEAGLLPPVSGG